MPLPPEHPRIDIVALKSQISHRLGPDRSRRYFNALNRFLAQKLSKQVFQRFCISTLGHENISLHNQLLLAILKNASLAKSPPPAMFKSTTYPALTRLNGDILPPTPRKLRSGVRRTKDRLVSNGRTEVGVHHNLVSSNEPVIRENGGSSPNWDLKRPFVGSTDLDEAEITSLSAPLGIPFCHASVGGAQKSTPSFTVGSFGDFSWNYEYSELCHTEDLKKRMERLAEAHGLGVSMESAQLLNNSVDAYLKRLIKSCVDLVGIRLRHAYKQHMNGKQINGIRPESSIHLQGSDDCAEFLHVQRAPHFVSLDDFKVAMELNPEQLGEDWPLLLEKICIRSFEK